MTTEAFIGLGGNEGDPVWSLQQAIARLVALPKTKLLELSPCYWTKPWGSAQPQGDYLNAVVRLNTTLTPHELLMALQVIEQDLGRQRTQDRYGPRTIDLDLLVFGEEIIDDEVLSVPHPRLAERAFVLVPLCDLAPRLSIPSLDRVDYLLEALEPEEMDGIRPAAISLTP